MFNIPDELKKLPDKPGVYLMKDEDENIIYVGKAKNLKNRVRQYFQSRDNQAPKVRAMTERIAEFEYIVTDTEVEALILENNLIKKHTPKYNIMLKDDKTYPYIKLTVNEEYPRLYMTRRHDADRAKYYGPFTSAMALKETIELLHRLIPLRKCGKRIVKNERPCLNYHIGNCTAPCCGLIGKQQYSEMVSTAIQFLDGKHDIILNELKTDMLKASDDLEFEKAAELRDKISAVKKLCEKQKIDSLTSDDRDVIAFAAGESETLIQIFFIRGGKITGREHFLIDKPHVTDEETLTAFVKQFYGGTPFIPKEISLQTEINDKEAICEWLSQIKGQKVSLAVPQRGEKKRLIELTKKNAELTLGQFGEQIKREKQRTEGALSEIKLALCLPPEFILNRIEAYDISNTSGLESVGSMVVFDNGKPKRSDYRKFKIKTVTGANDYASMEEVITRRFKRYLSEQAEEREGFGVRPDMIFVDGGRGQVSVAEKTLTALGQKIPVCGMIKDERHRTRGLIYQNSEIAFGKSTEGFKLVTRIQDEVHRFAIEYHRTLRDKGKLKSILDEIEGVGERRRKALLSHFGSLEGIKEASEEELNATPGMNKKSSGAVYRFFHK